MLLSDSAPWWQTGNKTLTKKIKIQCGTHLRSHQQVLSVQSLHLLPVEEEVVKRIWLF